jgi:hypothetical protein
MTMRNQSDRFSGQRVWPEATPEQKFLTEMIYSAVQDAIRVPRKRVCVYRDKAGRSHRYRCDEGYWSRIAREWLLKERGDWPISLEYCCEQLDLDVAKVRDACSKKILEALRQRNGQ